MSDPTVISTFSGPGGSSLGYERAGFDTRVALDCAPDGFADSILTTYKKNHPDTELIAKDARIATPDELLDAAGLDRGELDILDGSPPCSPFSSANAKVNWGDHKSGTLFDRYAFFIDSLEPRAFVAENVPDLAQGKTKGYFKILLDELRNAGRGYEVSVQKIDAAYLGASHHRRRLMFIGTRSDLPSPPRIEPTSQPTTVREAWSDLQRKDDSVKRAKKKCERSASYKYIKKLPSDATTSTDEVRTDGKTTGFTQYRLSFSKPAPTMTNTIKDFIHPSDDRYLTVREVARLIGLPDEYELPENYKDGFECAIRCLPPCLLETIGSKLEASVL